MATNNKKFWQNKYLNQDYRPQRIPLNNRLVQFIAGIPDKPQDLLWHGCGIGREFMALASSLKETKILANDIAEYPIEKLEKRIATFGREMDFDSFVGDISELKKPFSYILSHRVVHRCEDYLKQIDNLYRLLKPEGTIYITARSTLCVEYQNKKDRLEENNILRSDSGKFIKFFAPVEFQTVLAAAGFAIKEIGICEEPAATANRSSMMSYAIATKLPA